MADNSIKVDIRNEKARFKEHLNIGNNDRIIFSGMFGIGKSYFLNSFFLEEKELYEPFFISPVNYSVSKNEDIFEYIKYDILINLLSKKDVSWKKETFSNPLLAQYFIKDNFWKLAGDIIKHVGKVGKIVSEAITDLEKYRIEFENFKSKNNTDEIDEVISFLTEFEKKGGTIYENNDTTLLINALINSLPTTKKPVLIIDDLDRIDPEHIFRILNVFSAHFSEKKSEVNKFSFEKVILVCDLNNIRNLFQHKYGGGVDFSGYIDKFYSIEPYYFDNKLEILNCIDKFVDSIKCEGGNTFFFRSKPLLYLMVKYDIINLRKFVERVDTSWEHPLRKYPNIDRNLMESFIIVDCILFMFSNSKEDLLNALNKRKDEIDLNRDMRISLTYLCILLNKEKHNLREEEIVFENKELNIRMTYINKGSTSNYDLNIDLKTINTVEGAKKQTIPIFQILRLAIENYCDIISEKRFY